ncbi:GAF domain-containing sensor histidine kinase [Nocardioides gansuensis]|uniref:sensor histidine kinase n=1 Tax=Nocardioides gansuensis TaxID=2138300 RepID=UPI001402800C|nr:GAF domain-containing sensor histidine kinase [Nocardioides gansuensis]
MSSRLFREAFQLLAEGLLQRMDFEVCVISALRDDHMVVVAVAGSDAARERLLGARTPLARMEDELAIAETWGSLCFVPAERLDPDAEVFGWVPDIEESDEADAWHPLDLLFVPLRDAAGQLRGMLSLDLPRSRRRPDAQTREFLDEAVRQAMPALLMSMEQESLAERVRLATAAREAVRGIASDEPIDRIADIVLPAVMHGFGAEGAWLRTFDEDGSQSIWSGLGTGEVLPQSLVHLVEGVYRECWNEQVTSLVGAGIEPPAILTDEQATEIDEHLCSLGIASLLCVPLGLGNECLGVLSLARRPDDPPWSSVERDEAFDLGKDIGRALANARSYDREQRIIARLREVDAYKSQVIRTLAHELRNPLGAVAGHAELATRATYADDVRRSLDAIRIGTARMEGLVEDLLMLSAVTDPGAPLSPEPVDLAGLAAEAALVQQALAESAGLVLETDLPDEAVLALGDPDELDRVCANLLGNAIKYTPAGGIVTISARNAGDEVVLQCTDTGLGISEEDQKRLFEEFFRSTDPEAASHPGTGLGLAIVHRIVERHRGSIGVESKLGQGSTFSVRLPRA